MTDTGYRQPLFLSGTPRRAAENGGQNPTETVELLPRVDVKARTVPFRAHIISCTDSHRNLSLTSSGRTSRLVLPPIHQLAAASTLSQQNPERPKQQKRRPTASGRQVGGEAAIQASLSVRVPPGPSQHRPGFFLRGISPVASTTVLLQIFALHGITVPQAA